jgi:ribosomal protein S18 acetylase RimI-like enzyme
MMTSEPLHHTNILVREAQAEDAAVIVKLIRQLGAESEGSEPYVLHYLSGTDRAVLLAEYQGNVQGLLSYSIRADLFHAGNSLLIEELVVDEAARGLGIGSALLSALLERIQSLGCKELCLAVMPDNEGAIRFYKRHGLTEEALFLERHF